MARGRIDPVCLVNTEMLKLELDEGLVREYSSLVLDCSGTLTCNGSLLPGVAERLFELSGSLEIIVLTADTYGTARDQLAGLPVEVTVVTCGRDKLEALRRIGGDTAIAIGNGRNDIQLLEAAGLAIAMIGPEGIAAGLLSVADVVVREINDALDLLIHPLRLKATLRE